jgi:alpha-galactosidase
MLAAPLMAGNDVRNMSKEIRDLLTDKDVIAIDQDPLGKQAQRWEAHPDHEVWVKQLSHGEWAVCILNPGPVPATITYSWKELSYYFRGNYQVRDLWQKKSLSPTSSDFTGEIASHDVALFRLTPANDG